MGNGTRAASDPYLDLPVPGDTSKYSVDPLQPLNMLNRSTITGPPSTITQQVSSERAKTQPTITAPKEVDQSVLNTPGVTGENYKAP
jgi:hypothetical protein